MYGPSDTWTRLAAASSPLGGDLDDFADIFEVHEWEDGQAIRIGALSVLPRLVTHPTESYGLRITDPSGTTLVYSGTPGCVNRWPSLASGADAFLCEASWTDAPGKHLHLSRVPRRARWPTGRGGTAAAHPTFRPGRAVRTSSSEAKAEFDGPVHAVVAGETIEIARADG